MHDRRGDDGPDGRGCVRRRHVIYVEGYDPRGAEGYFELFARTCDRFERLWPSALTVRPLEIDSPDFAHWLVEMRGPYWRTATRYEFLRLERFIRADMARPAIGHLLRGLGWTAADAASGVQLRIFRASWRFGLHLLYFQLLLIAWLALPLGSGLALGALAETFGWSAPAAAGIAILAAFAAAAALSPVARKQGIVQIVCCWTLMRKFGRSRPTWLDHAINVGARRVLEVAESNAADELVIVGHSTGGVISSAIVARALEIAPDLGRKGPKLVLLTLGSVMPAVALHPAAQRIRIIVGRLASASNLSWIDCQSRKDVMCFSNFDPVTGTGVEVGSTRCNPRVWPIRFKDMMSPGAYTSFRRNFFRVHYQYIMAGNRPAPYDYICLVAGPMATAEWPARHREYMAALLRDETPTRADGIDDPIVSVSP
jgi:pimeloyl-ACP methyl ester carboxylesterase